MYKARCGKDMDEFDVIADTFFIYSIPYFSLIDIVSTHSYIASIVSVKLNISAVYNTSKVSVVCPLG